MASEYRSFPLLILIVGLLIVPLGVLSIGASLKQFGTARASKGWPAAPGHVVHSAVYASRGRKGVAYFADVRYAYSVASIDYEGRNISADDFGTNDRTRAEKIAARYPVGASVTVHYNPDDPSQAVLETGPSGGWLIGLLVGGVFILGMVFFWGVAVKGKSIAMPVFAVLFTAAGITLVVVAVRSYGPHWKLAWIGQRTQGKVIPLKDNDRFRMAVEYQVAGRSYHIPAESDTRQYSHGEVRVVYYSDKPSEAMIDSFEAIWLVPSLAIVAGLAWTGVGAGLLLRIAAKRLSFVGFGHGQHPTKGETKT